MPNPIIEEVVEQRQRQQIASEEEMLASLLLLYKDQTKKHKDIVREVYEKYGQAGVLERAELYKYGRDKEIKKKLLAIHQETGKKELALIEASLVEEMKEEALYTLFLLETLETKVTKEALSTKAAKEVLKERWMDETHKETISRNKKEQSAQSFQKIILAANSKQTLKDALKEAEKTAKTGINKTFLTYQTELTHKKNVLSMELYVRYLDEKLQWVATLDKRTCAQCGGLDGNVYEIGKQPTAPAHPRCRCRLVAYFPEHVLRRARDPKTGRNNLTDTQTYKEWKTTVYGGE